MKVRKRFVFYAAFLFVLMGLTSCSFKKMVLKKVATTLTEPQGEKVFTGDNDPELVADALPFAIKLYESLLMEIPFHRRLRLKTGSMYVMYAHAFLDIPSRMLTDENYCEKERLQQRAKNLYMRGRDILLTALEKKYPGFLKRLNGKNFDEAVKQVKKGDIDLLYWAGAGWMGALSLDPFDVDLGMTPLRPGALLQRAMEIDEHYGNGAIHEFFILYYGSLPDHMGGDAALARQHFKEAVEISGGESSSPYISLAITVVRNEQNREEFKSLLVKALAIIDTNAQPGNELIDMLNRRRAEWLLAHIDDFFL